MADNNKPSLSKLLINLLFLVFPTLVVFYLAIDNVTGVLSFLKREISTEISIIACSASLAFIIHYFRVRAWITFVPVILTIIYLSNKVATWGGGEFDNFYITIKFQHFAVLFVLSWLMGYSLARFRYTPHIIGIVSLICGFIVMGSQEEINLWHILDMGLPILGYAFYIIYSKEYIEDLDKVSFKSFFWQCIKAGIFIGLILLTFNITKYLLKGEIKEANKALQTARANEGKGDAASRTAASKDKLLKENPDGTFDINEIAKLDRRQNSATGNAMKELLFVTYLDNFLSGSDNVPMPYYYVSYYLNKYDTKKEQFVRDANPPFNDNFTPLPQQLPMLINLTDTTVLGTVKNLKARNTKEVLVYMDKLNPNHFTAPATAYAVEPIPVDPDFKDKYKFAYRAKSYTSYLNEAFFVYNHPHPIIQKFNNERYDVLKSVKNYKNIPDGFMQYYTEVPKTPLHDSIAALAKAITKGAKLPSEKVRAVRDYFKSKKPDGKPLFKYTLEVMKPSEPNIPNQKMLSNFLFKTHKGYCTYYAAASLFMLRSQGIPVRFTTGFLIEDRSAGKNEGWYTVYGSQAHAWIQVYFPEYGWLDFDSTIPDDAEQQNAPKPDGTPPLTIPKVYFSGYGKVLKIDTLKCIALMELQEMNFRNREYSFINAPILPINLKKSTIYINKEKAKVKDIKENMKISAVVYSNIFKNLKLPEEYGTGKAFVDAMTKPTPIDEVHIKLEIPKKKDDSKPKELDEDNQWGYTFLWISLAILGIFALLVLFSPTIVFYYYKWKASTTNSMDKKAYYVHMFALYTFNQLGYYRGAQTTFHYASKTIDPLFNIEYGKFANVFLKLKYSNSSLSEQDNVIVTEFHKTLLLTLSNKIVFIKKLKAATNYIMLQKFFTLPEEE